MSAVQTQSKRSPAPGHNKPPGPIEFARGVVAEVSAWLADHPVIETESEARAAKPLIDRAKAALEAVEAERDSLVRPLNEEVARVNATYKAVHNTDPKKPATFDKVLAELRARIAAFLRLEEERRLQAAREAARLARDAEDAARAAEAAEAEAFANAAAGEVGVDVAAVTAEADTAFSTFTRTSRFAAVAERDTRVRLGGGFGNSVGLRDKKELVLVDAAATLAAVGVTEKVREALLSSAREYRKERGSLPAGVIETSERGL